MLRQLLGLALCFQIWASPPLQSREGFLPVTGGPVWYKVLGSGTKTPVLMVHGGPGGRSCRMEPMALLLSRERPVILYDQLGGGRSGRPEDSRLWTLERFTRELGEVRRGLGLDRVHLLGHSFGGTLALEYLATHPRQGIASVILSGPTASTPLWLEDTAILRGRLPAEIQVTLARHEREGTTHSAEYLEAVAVFERRHIYRRPGLVPTACDGSSELNRVIYETLWGPNEFTCTGSLKTFDRTPILPGLRMPVLFLGGRHDEILPESLGRLCRMTPGAEMHVFEESGHLALFEEKEQYAEVVAAFLRAADAKGASAPLR